MKQILCIAVVAAVLASTASAQTTAPTATLHLGDAAPALRIAHWYKGDPIPAFQPGHIYVVEFWATWCGPCKVSIPHLTVLQKKFGDKVTIIGVDVSEHDATDAGITKLVEPFVQKMGDQMVYTVAGDGPDDFMNQHWLRAAGAAGIPTAFVVLADAKIGWIGHPLGLDAVLAKVADGTWDVAAERRRIDDAAAVRHRRNDAIATLRAAQQAKDWAGVIAARDALVAKSPELAKNPDVVSFAMQALFNSNPKQAIAYVADLYGPTGLVTTGVLRNSAVFRVLPGVPVDGLMKPADWQAVADLVRDNVEHAKNPGYGYYTGYADVLWRAGNVEQATRFQQKGVDMLAAWNDTHKDNLAPASRDLKVHQQARLAQMKEGKGYTPASTQPVGAAG